MKSSNKTPRKHGHNVVELAIKKRAVAEKILPELAGKTARAKGSPDVRVKEAMRLAQAFLAIEDPVARNALIELAERLVSYDWIRKVK